MRRLSVVSTWYLLIAALPRTSSKSARLHHTTPMPITVLTTLPSVPAFTGGSMHPHFNETLLAIAENALSPRTFEVRVLIDKFHYDAIPMRATTQYITGWGEDDTATIALRDAVLTVISSWRSRELSTFSPMTFTAHLKKLHAHVYGQQPTYAQMFRFAGTELRGRLVALLNADVVLRHTDMIESSDFDAQPPLALAISVRPPTGHFLAYCSRKRFTVIDRCDSRVWRHAGSSWDVHIFKSPLVNARYELLEEVQPHPVYMNQLGAENRVGLFLKYSGYALYNPCRLGLAEHWHCTSKTHFPARIGLAERVDVNKTTRVKVGCRTRGIDAITASRSPECFLKKL